MVSLKNGVEIRVICGDIAGTKGPVKDIVIDPQYLDVSVPRDSEFIHTVKRGHTAFAYVYEGSGQFDDQKGKSAAGGSLVLFSDGDQVAVRTGRNRSGSCWFRENPSESRWPGAVPS